MSTALNSNVDVSIVNIQLMHTRDPLFEETHYYPFGLIMKVIGKEGTGVLQNKLKYNGIELQYKEFSDGSGLEEYAALYRNLDPQIGRWWQIDPVIKENESPYSWNTNDPIRFSDFDGRDSAQRAKALIKAKEYVNKNPGNSYELGAKGDPGQKVDCSGLVTKVVEAGNEPNPNHGNKNGVSNIADNTKVVEEKDVVPGNIVITDSKSHTGIITVVERDKDGKIVNEQMVDSGGRPEKGKSGPRVINIIIDGKKQFWPKIDGYRKWDTKPDKNS